LWIADCGFAGPSIRKITTLKEKWPEGFQTFRPFNFAISNQQSAISNPQSSPLLLYFDSIIAEQTG